MTDEEMAVLILETRDRLRGPLWCDTDEDTGRWREVPRAREHMTAVVREVRHRLDSSQREQTAATILAALVGASGMEAAKRVWDESGLVGIEIGFDDHERAMYAVALADVLRAELAAKKP